MAGPSLCTKCSWTAESSGGRKQWGQQRRSGSVVTLWYQKDQPQIQSHFERQSILWREFIWSQKTWIQMQTLSFIICGTLQNSWIFLNFSSSGVQELAYSGWEPFVNTSSQSCVHLCYSSNLKLGTMGVFISQKLANIINQGSSNPKEPVVKHLSLHHWFQQMVVEELRTIWLGI